MHGYVGLCVRSAAESVNAVTPEVPLVIEISRLETAAPIIGPRTMEQLESAVRATEIALDDEVLAMLDEIFPGPGGEAPMAYAW